MAAAGKIRCPLRPAPVSPDRDRPEILTPPEDPQACCTRQTITVPPEVNAETRQKHDYPPAAWRRLTGLAALMFFTVTLLIVRSQRIIAARDARQEDNARRAARGLPPKTRKRRRKTLATLAAPP
jgi:hypothetical protein